MRYEKRVKETRVKMGNKCYLEPRTASARGSDSLAADITRHLHTRQYLGRAVVICHSPHAMLSAMRKQWLKLSRIAQKQRASTLNADKILKYTHVITHMQHLRFTQKPPLENPDADVYILSADEAGFLPAQCWSVYTEPELPSQTTESIASQLPAEALVIDYAHCKKWAELGLSPKQALEERVAEQWRHAHRFLTDHNIDVRTFSRGKIQNVEAIDDALDTLLAVSHNFLAIANEFQRTLELARPIKLAKKLREDYDAFILLAHRVQALSPGAFTQRFLETYNEDDTFFLQDRAKQNTPDDEKLAEVIERHSAAGRHRLARALYAKRLVLDWAFFNADQMPQVADKQIRH